jgi:hypothetical protein
MSEAFASSRTWSGALNATIGPDAPFLTPLAADKRDLISIRAAGQIKVSGEAPWRGPQGTDFYGFGNEDMPPFGYTQGIVILKIGANHIPIEGGSRTFISPHAGALSIYINDDNSSDNLGNFDIRVEIWPLLDPDMDEDSIEDALEDQLLEIYAPDLKFDANERYRPSDALWHLRNSSLLADGDEHSEAIIASNQVPYYTEWFICQNKNNVKTNYMDTPEFVERYANIRNSHRHGLSWERILAARNIGVYGHVVPYPDLNGIKIEYWLFYGMNDTPPIGTDSIGEHEGDWELFEVVADATDPTNVDKMIQATWHGHGADYLARWNKDSEWRFCATDSTNWANCHVKEGLPLWKARPKEKPPQHAPVYVEANTHGSWPMPCETVGWSGTGLARGNDGDHSYVVENVPNLGELMRPRLGLEVILHYNGRWGAWGVSSGKPSGPVLHRQQWAEPPGTRLEAIYVGTYDQGSIHPNGTAEKGRISWPLQSVSQAINSASNGQPIIIFPGAYNEAVTINRPVILKFPYGDVIIGASR